MKVILMLMMACINQWPLSLKYSAEMAEGNKYNVLISSANLISYIGMQCGEVLFEIQH